MSKKHVGSISVTPDFFARLKAAAEKRGVPMSKLVEDAVKPMLGESERSS